MTARERATLKRFINTSSTDMRPVDWLDLLDRVLTILSKDFIAAHDALWVEPKEEKIVEVDND